MAEIKTSGELAIETKGKQVKVNASEDNPAVHVARDGNDVVKRARTLTKLVDATEEGESEPKEEEAISGEEEPEQNGHNSHDENGANNEGSDSIVEDDNAATEKPEEQKHVSPDTEKVEVGEKRRRGDDDSGEAESEKEEDEKESGKETKKVKLDDEHSAENGHDAENGHVQNENGRAHLGNGNGVKKTPVEEEAPKKTKGPGRPKKADVEAKQSGAAVGDGSTIARRTRSKA